MPTIRSSELTIAERLPADHQQGQHGGDAEQTVAGSGLPTSASTALVAAESGEHDLPAVPADLRARPADEIRSPAPRLSSTESSTPPASPSGASSTRRQASTKFCAYPSAAKSPR